VPLLPWVKWSSGGSVVLKIGGAAIEKDKLKKKEKEKKVSKRKRKS
jgi:hypothetical protein